MSTNNKHFPTPIVAAFLAIIMLFVCTAVGTAGAETLREGHKHFYRTGSSLDIGQILKLSDKPQHQIGEVIITYNMIRSQLEVEWLYNDKVVSRTKLPRGLRKTVHFTYNKPLPASIEARFTSSGGQVQIMEVSAEIEPMTVSPDLQFQTSVAVSTLEQFHAPYLTVKANDEDILLRFFVDPVFIRHLRQTKKVFDANAFRQTYFVRAGYPYMRTHNGQEVRLIPSSIKAKVSPEQVRRAIFLPSTLEQYSSYLFSGSSVKKSAVPPSLIDYRLVQSKVKNQGNRCTCCAHAILAAMEAFRSVPRDLSEEYAYHMFMMNYPGSPQNCAGDPGFFSTPALELLQKNFVCEEKYWPYSNDPPASCPAGHQPPQQALNNCRYGVKDFRVLLDLSNVKEIKNKVALRASNGKYVCADWENNDRLVANRVGIGEFETFEWIMLPGKRVALIACNGKYVSADRKKGDILVADRDASGDWEAFELVPLQGDRVALRASNGKYVCADADQGGRLIANRSQIKEWETFTVVRHLDCLNVKNTAYLEAILAAGYPIILRTTVLWDDKNAKGIIDVKLDVSERPLVPAGGAGTHFMLIVGYNRSRQIFIVKNSHGDSWGHNGYGYFHYDYIRAYSLDGAYILDVN